MEPPILIEPYGVFCPGATVPSWQLRQRILDEFAVGTCGAFAIVVLEYGV